ncbi:60s acidic ribosomal protein-domain-containing protein [Hypoxylon argillaceum]|nr:60s acidic ribosomal protein-domain-containing protein [Hypoxylon argillaceum]
MKHLAAYLLLGLGGNTSPSASDIKKVLDSVGIEADEDRLDTLISELKGKDINELIAEGSTKLASVPSGGGGGGGAAGGAAAGGAAAAEEKVEEKEEGGVRRRHGLWSLRLSVSHHLLWQRRYMILGNWHKNGLRWSCMASGVDGFAFDHSQGLQSQARQLESVKANISGPASPNFIIVTEALRFVISHCAYSDCAVVTT